ncbi:MAG: mandelate racemase/muconate lactonizing enzyme family protein [Thermoplasmatales archaeon]
MLKTFEKIKASIPLDKTDPEQMWLQEWGNQLFVKIENHNGKVGWGEVLAAAGNSREPYIAILDMLSDYVISADENNIREMWDNMRRMTFSGGYGITTGAIAGIDIALWDLLGKELGSSISIMLGKRRRSVNRYVSLSRYSNPEKAALVVKNLLSLGYESIKLHQSRSDTLETVKIIREELGYDFDLMVDMNCSMDFEAAKEFMNKANKYELKWVEEPIWPPDDFDSLRKLNQIGPVAAGENFFSIFDFKRLLEDDCLTYYQPDVTKIGGITPMIEIMGLLKAHNALLAFHNRPHNGWIGIMASAILACSYDGNAIVETPPNEIPEIFAFYGKIDRNTITPQGNGLGIEPKGEIPLSDSTKMLRFH